MLESPFAFYRGGAAIMAADLATTPTSGIEVQLCGDAHLLNFGIFRTAERMLAFDINDFDETHWGPWEWDVKRLAASFEIAGRDLQLGASSRRRAVATLVASYRTSMASFATMGNLDVWYAHIDIDRLRTRLRKERTDRDRLTRIETSARRAMTHDHLTAFEKHVEVDDGELRFVHRPPQLVPVEYLLDEEARDRYQEVIGEFLRQYRESLRPDRRLLLESYRFVHIARKIVGVGSVGTRAWVVLMMGRDADDPLVLQLKEAQQSVLESYLPHTRWPSNGERVVRGQRLMQAAGDPLLGWYRLLAFDGRVHEFYVRQLWDGKASIDLAGLSGRGLSAYAELCGWTLARAHARSGDRVAIAGYLGSSDRFDEAIADFATTYADLNEADYQAFADAVESGRLDAVRGV